MDKSNPLSDDGRQKWRRRHASSKSDQITSDFTTDDTSQETTSSSQTDRCHRCDRLLFGCKQHFDIINNDVHHRHWGKLLHISIFFFFFLSFHPKLARTRPTKRRRTTVLKCKQKPRQPLTRCAPATTVRRCVYTVHATTAFTKRKEKKKTKLS